LKEKGKEKDTGKRKVINKGNIGIIIGGSTKKIIGSNIAIIAICKQ